MLSPGDKIKDCEVIAPLGSGGMAKLYLARRRGVGGFSRLVTLKVVHQHLSEDANIVRLFLDEARISAHIAHPNVVHVEEVGRYGDSYFIAMEYVHGVSLAELLGRLTERRLRLRPKLCVWLAAQIAEALHAAHEAKSEDGSALDIVHRDVSPQNVLIGHTGHVKLIDFGIAKSHAESDQRSGGRAVLGKLRYMSPEQLRLERADRRTDVYALGVMLWEMLAGRSLLRCQRFDDERDWATRENPPPPSKYSTHSTPSLDRVVLRAIAFDPSERYDSAFQFRTALLRADPAAVKLDAPMVAGLMRTMLGEELDRRRASWPSEIAGELEVKPDVTTSQAWSLEELTAENPGLAALSAEAVEPALIDEPGIIDLRPEVDDNEPTVALRNSQVTDSLSALAAPRVAAPLALAPADVTYATVQQASPENAVFVLPAQIIDDSREHMLHCVPVLVPQSAIDTLKVPPTSARPPEIVVASPPFRAATLGTVCLVAGVFLGILLSPSPQADGEVVKAEPAPITRVPVAAAAPVVAAPVQPLAAAAIGDTVHLPSPPPPEPVLLQPVAAEECEVVAQVDPKLLTATRIAQRERRELRQTRSYGARKPAKAKKQAKRISHRIKFTDE